MRKLTIIVLLTIGIITSASAHHMAQYDDAGIYIPETSPHLLMTFF